MRYQFEWDPDKAVVHLKKHGVSFELATDVFKDPMTLTLYDEDNSDEGDRWITLGQVQQNYLVVVHTYRDSEDNTVRIRIISARPATKAEIKQYEG